MNRLKLIFFDLDDTLFEYHGDAIRYAEKAALSEINQSISLTKILKIYDIVKRKEDDEYANKKIPMKEFYDIASRFSRLLNELGIYDKSKSLSERMARRYWKICEDVIRPFPDTEFVLRKLKNKYELGILTNGLVMQQKRRLSSLGLTYIFDYFFTSESIGTDKSSQKYFDSVFKIIEHRNYECALVGNDPINDIETANSIGMTTIWFNRKKLQKRVGAHFTINEFKDLLEIL